MATSTKTTCAYCGVGCGIIAKTTSDGQVEISGDKNHPANFGRLCSKGSALGETLGDEGRLLYPQINGERRDWNSTLQHVADRFSKAIEEHGPDSVAFYVSGQLLTEDYYVANKLMKGFIGSANIDTNSRLCMASSVAGHKRAFGSDTVPGTYEDLEQADLVTIVGSNLAWCHPVLFQRISDAKAKRPEMKIVLIDPRRTMTAEIADQHLALAPDSDVALFNGLLHHLGRNNAIDRDYVAQHTNGFVDAMAKAGQTINQTSRQTGIAKNELEAFYRLYRKTEKSVTIYSQGVNQSVGGTDKVNAIINCHLATGRIGKPGMGPFSVTGQPNAMGGREVGGLANMLAAHMDIKNDDHQKLVRRFWGTDNLATKPGLKAVDLFKAVADGQIKALWIMATNPVDSLPDAGFVEDAIKKCDFVVVSDVLEMTDTVRHADVKLPSLGWGEKDGTVTNSERCISRQRRFLPAPGEAKADWWQICEVAKRMGFGEHFDYLHGADIFREHAALSSADNNGKRAFNIGAYAAIAKNAFDELEPFYWPALPDRHANDDNRMFGSGKFTTPDGRANFISTSPLIGDQKTHLLTLNTGRIRDHWHTMTRTGRSQRNSSHIAEPFCEIHPADAEALGVGDVTLVDVSTDLGQIRCRVQITPRQQQGNVFVPMHWSEQFASNARVDKLIASHTDPVSGQPGFKNTPVDLTPVAGLHHGFLISQREPQPNDKLAYWAKAKTNSGWRLEFACDQATQAGLKDLLDSLTDAEPTIEYCDARGKQTRKLWFDKSSLLLAMYLAPQPVELSRHWACEQLSKSHDDLAARAMLAAGRPGQGQPDKGAIVCSCMAVGVNDIRREIERGCGTVNAIGKATTAGTNCGSCKSEISGLINEFYIDAAQ